MSVNGTNGIGFNQNNTGQTIKGYSNSRTTSAPMTMVNSQQPVQYQQSRPSSQAGNPNSFNALSKNAVIMREMDKPSSVSSQINKFNKAVNKS